MKRLVIGGIAALVVLGLVVYGNDGFWGVAEGLVGWVLILAPAFLVIAIVQFRYKRAECARRADEQHRALLDGDIATGIFGQYTPYEGT